MISFSIIVPVYNCAQYLRRCVDSILRQSYSYFELILVDDGSTDNSGVICDNYAAKDKHVRVFHQSNKGPSASRNCGIINAFFEFLIFVDGDDYLQPNAIYQMEKLVTNYQSDIVIYGYNKINCDEKLVQKLCPVFNGTINKNNFINDASYFLNNMFYHVIFNKIYRKDIIKRYNVSFDEKVSVGEDLLFNLLYFEHSLTFSFVSVCFYNHYIDNDNSIMNGLLKGSHRPNINHYLVEFNYLNNFFKKNSNSNSAISMALEKYIVQTIDAMINNMVVNKTKRLPSSLKSFIKQCKSDVHISYFSCVKWYKWFYIGWLLNDPILLILRSKMILLRYRIILMIRK